MLGLTIGNDGCSLVFIEDSRLLQESVVSLVFSSNVVSLNHCV